MSFKFNPFTGKLDLVGSGSGGGSSSPDNFSYKVISVGETVEIPANQQMLVDGHIRVLGHLLVSGELVDISNRKPEQFFYDTISDGECVVVEPKRLLLYKDHITIQGHLRVLGRMEAA